jgi:hypothetical protein
VADGDGGDRLLLHVAPTDLGYCGLALADPCGPTAPASSSTCHPGQRRKGRSACGPQPQTPSLFLLKRHRRHHVIAGRSPLSSISNVGTRWIYSTCQDAVDDELGCVSPPVSPTEALDCHTCVYHWTSAPPSPVSSSNDLIVVLHLLLCRSSGYRRCPRRGRHEPRRAARGAMPPLMSRMMSCFASSAALFLHGLTLVLITLHCS